MAALVNSIKFPTRNGRQISVLVSIAGFFFLASTLWPLLGSAPGQQFRLVWTGTTHQVQSHQQQIVEMEGLALGNPFSIPTNITLDVGRLDMILEPLQARFDATTGNAAVYPSCTLDLSRYEKTAFRANALKQSIVSIAINLHDSEVIIPAQSMALVTAIGHLLQTNKVYISIFENASRDKTKALLSDLAAALQAVGVDGLWMHSSHMRSDFALTDRIVMLAEIRNLALTPLLPYASSGSGEEDAATLLFLNDIVTCASDLLELIHQQRLQRADMAVGLDWGTVNYSKYNITGRYGTRIYDMWVLRGINGELPYPFEKPSGYAPTTPNVDWVGDVFYTQDVDIRRRWRNGRALPIYSGWGGMAAFNASLFADLHLRFRSSRASGWEGGSRVGAMGAWGRLLGMEEYMESDCPGASECKYIARDIWNLRHGQGTLARIVLAPRVRTTYNVKDWEVMRHLVPANGAEGKDEHEVANGADEDLIDWSRVRAPEMVVCIPTYGELGEHMGVWDEQNERQMLPPLIEWNATVVTG